MLPREFFQPWMLAAKSRLSLAAPPRIGTAKSLNGIVTSQKIGAKMSQNISM
jgi:hypothetical protein